MSRRKTERTEATDPLAELLAPVLDDTEAAAGGEEAALLALAGEEDAQRGGADASADAPTAEGQPEAEGVGGSGTARRRRRGRPPNPPAPERLTKAELVRRYERLAADHARLDGELQAERARGATEAIGRLAAALATAGKLATNLVAHRRGAHWRLTEEEAESLGQAWAVCLAPYADQLADWMPWGIAIGLTYQVVDRRLQQDKMALAEPAEVQHVQ